MKIKSIEILWDAKAKPGFRASLMRWSHNNAVGGFFIRLCGRRLQVYKP